MINKPTVYASALLALLSVLAYAVLISDPSQPSARPKSETSGTPAPALSRHRELPSQSDQTQGHIPPRPGNDSSAKDDRPPLGSATPAVLSFASEMALNRSFLSEQGVVYESTIKQIFRTETLQHAFERLNHMEGSLASYQREQALNEAILSLTGIADFNALCRGLICLAEITVNDARETEGLKSISGFDDNHTFDGVITDDSGLTHYRAVFIKTEDPSTLSIDRS
ncbi:hypothetical protein Fbal_1458 [Ferrimonas balearica DSM 9799]|uniref:Uncharacterized protein n=1 Tax=Ferrimonas balearica (strain DSM 9799 / CCM 4581 / KCTC 23876 / PAT) TaxID=550540 RepID=E1SNH8_FERBD|nr:hypothetical protein [Ferrimonas balearica]ADN75662.1 hypothetical protein Fbal_1458 [Ferrimonas balearica DSM 9799]